MAENSKIEWVSVDHGFPDQYEEVLVWAIFEDESLTGPFISWVLDLPDDHDHVVWQMGRNEGYQITHWAYITDPVN